MSSNGPYLTSAQQSSWPPPRAGIATVRKRADKACQPCRARKVRCNVTDNGEPCNNCRLREVTCVPSGNRPSRKKSQNTSKSLSWINKHSQAPPRAAKNRELEAPDITTSSFRLWTEMDGHEEDRGDIHDMWDADPSSAISNLVQTVSIHGDRTATRLDESKVESAKESAPAPLPGYIKPLPQSMTTDDTKFLWAKGALSIPDTVLRNELVRCYIEFVHPELPLLELHDFLRAIDKGVGEEGGISLVLFQAVMFSGTAFVDISILQEAGYSTRREVRTAFYQRARLLYDFDYEDDRIALLQSLLLMTLYCENPDNQKDGWHWTGVAISLAHTLGIHRNLEMSVTDIKRLRLYRRMWWCCIMRDRLLSLGMRRPPRIDDGDYDVPMLTVEDFEIQSLDSDNRLVSSDCSIIRDPSMQTHMAMICIAKARLCLCINHVLAAQYSAHVQDHGMEGGPEGKTQARLMLVPKPSSQTYKINNCDIELADWFQRLPTSCRWTATSIHNLQTGSAATVVQRAILHMLYFSTISTLHRPRALPTAKTNSPHNLQEISRWKIRDASNEITKIMLDLHSVNLTRYLPVTGVTVLLPAIIIHLLDSNSFSDETRDAGRKGLSQCMHVLQQLRDSYAPADDAILFLEGALRKSNIDLGILNMTQNTAAGVPTQGNDGRTVLPQKTVQNVPGLTDHQEVIRSPPLPHRNITASVSSQHDAEWDVIESDEEDSESLQSASTSPETGSQFNDVTANTGPFWDTETFSPSMGGIDNTDFDYVFQALIDFNDHADAMDFV